MKRNARKMQGTGPKHGHRAGTFNTQHRTRVVPRLGSWNVTRVHHFLFIDCHLRGVETNLPVAGRAAIYHTVFTGTIRLSDTHL